MTPVTIAAAMLIVAALYAARRVADASAPATIGGWMPGAAEIEAFAAAGNRATDTLAATWDAMQSITVGGSLDTDSRRIANRAAMLDAIAWAEGADYRTLYGGRDWQGSDADHPAALGWAGVQLPDHLCAGAGLSPGCKTTAAGRYQILLSTWRRVKDRLSLPDFGPASQDAAALELISDAGALADVDAGRFDAAVNKCRRIWASLPGAGYGQPERNLAALRGIFQQSGGVVIT